VQGGQASGRGSVDQHAGQLFCRIYS
jgi:hypothetical protein